MKFGAIHWRADHDKQRVERVTPISKAVREELDLYLICNPRNGDAPLLPAVEDPTRPLARTVATKWLAKAEQRAALPKLRRGLWHPYRRLWATERKELPEVDVAVAGGWTGTKAMKLSYQKHTPAGVLAAILNAR
jgi:integrase